MVQIFNPQVHNQQAVPFQQLPQQPGYYNNPNDQQDDGQPKNALDYILGRFGAGGASGIESGVAGGIQAALKRSALEKMLSSVNPDMSAKDRLGLILNSDPKYASAIQQTFKQQDAQRVQQQQQKAQEALQNSYRRPEMQQGAEQAVGQSPAGQIHGQPNISNNLTDEELAIYDALPSLSPNDQKIANQKLKEIAKQKQTNAKEQKEAIARERELSDKETEGFRDYISKERKSYEKNNFLIKNMERLVDTKKLDNPVYYSLLKKIHMDLPALLNTESQEYIKYQQEYLTGVKEALGSQISAWEVEQYMKKIPTLENTDEGKRAIFRNQIIENEARGALVKAYDEILAENGGHRPRDIEVRAKERADIIKGKLADEFRQNAGLEQPQNAKPQQSQAAQPVARPGYVIMINPDTKKGEQVLQSDVEAASTAGWK